MQFWYANIWLAMDTDTDKYSNTLRNVYAAKSGFGCLVHADKQLIWSTGS